MRKDFECQKNFETFCKKKKCGKTFIFRAVFVDIVISHDAYIGLRKNLYLF